MIYQGHNTRMKVLSWLTAQQSVMKHASDCVGKLVYTSAVLSVLKTCAKRWVFSHLVLVMDCRKSQSE